MVSKTCQKLVKHIYTALKTKHLQDGEVGIKLSDLQKALAIEAAAEDSANLEEATVKAVETLVTVETVLAANATQSTGIPGRYIDPSGNCSGQEQAIPKGMISYPLARYSTGNEAQRTGTSETRQLRNAEEVSKRFEWKYDISLAVLDLKTSAHQLTKKGIPRNFSPDAALGAFLEAAKKNRLPKNAVLIVDDPSRFSRTVLSVATGAFWELISNGVCIYIISMSLFVNERSLEDPVVQTRILFEFERTYRESFNKVKMINDAKLINIQKAISMGIAVGLGWHPTWIKYNKPAKKNQEIKDKADIVRELIRRAVNLESLPDICRAMRDNNIPTLSKKAGAKWRVSTIRKILNSEVIIGVLNANIKIGMGANGKKIMKHIRIVDFFPRLCSSEDWVKLQARFAIHRGRGGRRLGHAINNLFPGRVLCAECGCPMSVGTTTNRKWEARMYQCHNDKCKHTIGQFPVIVLEKDLFSLILRETPNQHLEAGADAHESKNAMLTAQLAEAQEMQAAAVAMALDQPRNAALRGKAKEIYNIVTNLEDELKTMAAAVTLAEHTEGSWGSFVKDLGISAELISAKSAEQIVEFGRVLDVQLSDMNVRARLVEKFKCLVAGIDINPSTRKWTLRLFSGEEKPERDCSGAVAAHKQSAFASRFTPEVRRRMSAAAHLRAARRMGNGDNASLSTEQLIREALKDGPKTRTQIIDIVTDNWNLGYNLKGTVWAVLGKMFHRQEVVRSYVPGQKKTKLYDLV